MVVMIPPEGAQQFLTSAGWANAKIAPLAGDASFRRYFRVAAGARDAVLMDAPPPHEDPRPFIAIAEWLVGHGFAAPRIIASDLDQGLLLIEDFGSRRMREAVDADKGIEFEVYRGVTDLLVALHKHTPPPLEVHGLDRFLEEVGLFPEWYAPFAGINVDQAAYVAAWRAVLEPVCAALTTPVLELRDYHAENVMLIDGADGLARYGLLDFQDALQGHPAYDLASMLQDARRDVPPVVERAMLERYLQATGAGNDFETAYWVLAAQRNTRILGLFVRLWKRDQKPHYTRFQPRMWGLLERDLEHPALAPVRDWFDAHVSLHKRAQLWWELGL
jgi:N-acetylmuramate 1-kinase